MNGIWIEYEHIMSLNFADVVSWWISNDPRGSLEVPALAGQVLRESRGSVYEKCSGKLLCILDPNGHGHGENQRSKDVFLCGCEWLHLIHTLLEGLEGHLTSMFLFLKCFSSLYENWYMNTMVTVSTYQIGTQCCLNLFLCARSSFLQVLEPFRAKCGWHWLENCYSRGKDWWKSDEVVPLQGGVAFGKQPDSWCSQYKWQICMHW